MVKYLSFDGTDDDINFGDFRGTLITNPGLTGKLTVEFWANIKSGYYILSSGGQTSSTGIFISYGNGSPAARLTANSKEWRLNFPIQTDIWAFWSLVWDGTKLEMFKNGVSVGSTTTTTNNSFTENATTFTVGRPNSATNFRAKMDFRELRIWDVVKTPAEIQADMNSQLAGMETGLEFYWKMNEGSGSTVYDSTENPKNGTVTGAAWLDDGTGGGDTGTTQDGQATVTASGSLTATGQRIQPASAYLQGQGALSAIGKREQLSTANLLAQSLLQADSQAIRQATANLLASGILIATADGVSIITASASLLGSGLLNATSKREQLGASSLIGQGVFNIDTGDVTIITASADLRGTGRLTADSQRIAQAVSSLIGSGLLDSAGQRIVNSQASLLGGGVLTADSYKIVIADASLVGSGILAVLDGEPIIGTIHLKGDIQLNVYLVAKRELNVNLQGKQELNVHLKGAIQ